MTSSSVQDGRRPQGAFVGRERELSELNINFCRCCSKPSSSLKLERKGCDALLEVRS
jgi:hypothetical protein